MKRVALIITALILTLGLLAAGFDQTTLAATPKVTAADFYKKNTVDLVVGFGPGGGSDVIARSIASYWTEATDGIGTMLVKNKPGGGTLVGMNHVFAAKPDGLTIGGFPTGTSMLIPVMFGDPAVKFDIAKMGWIGALPNSQLVFGISSKLPYKSMAEVQKVKGLKVGHIEGTPSMGCAVVVELFQLPGASVIVGYTAGSKVGLALGTGELNGGAVSSGSWKSYVDSGFAKEPFVTLDFERAVLYPNVPAVPELIKLSADQEKILWLLRTLHGSWVMWTPPGVPVDRLEFLRKGFDKLVTIQGFQRLFEKGRGDWMPPVDHKGVAKEMETALSLSPSDIAKFKHVTEKYNKGL